MNKVYKRIFNLVAIVTMALAINIVALAQGTTMIAVSKESPSVGDSVTVSITASESGTVTVKYTSSMLTFSSCNVSGYSSSGNTVSFSGKSGNVTFTAASAGKASIIVSSSSCSGSSTTLQVGGGAAETTVEETPAEETTVVEETEEPVEEAPAETTEVAPVALSGDAVGTLNSEGGFDINGVAYVVSERYADSDMPSGFTKKTIQIGSSTYSEPTNGAVTLLYLKQADNIGGAGTFYAYNAEAGTVSQFLMLSTSSDSIFLSEADATPSSAFQATTLEVTGGTATAYTISGGEFYYVYGTNKSGTTGWFVYDSTNDTVSRLDESLLSASASAATDSASEGSQAKDSVDVYIKKLDTYRKVIMGLIVLCVILVFLIINSMVKSKDKDDDDFDGDVFAKAPAKPAKKLPRSIVFGSRKNKVDEEEYEDEEEEYYDDDYAEDEQEDDRASAVVESASNYDTRRSSSLNMMDLNDL